MEELKLEKTQYKGDITVFCCDAWEHGRDSQYYDAQQVVDKLKAELEASEFHNKFHIECNEKLKAEIADLKEREWIHENLTKFGQDGRELVNKLREAQAEKKEMISEFEDWLNDIQKNSPEWQSFKERYGR
jgi:predicted RNase H-like nuclease (RuvC/YqgF family)